MRAADHKAVRAAVAAKLVGHTSSCPPSCDLHADGVRAEVAGELAMPTQATGVIRQVKESFVNATKEARYGETDWQDTDRTTSQLYRAWSREYGRCSSKVYVDKRNGGTAHAGWTFIKRVEYEDARPGRGDMTYLREVWCTWRFVKPCDDAVAPGLCRTEVV